MPPIGASPPTPNKRVSGPFFPAFPIDSWPTLLKYVLRIDHKSGIKNLSEPPYLAFEETPLTLYLLPTPIGNLSDTSFRFIECVKDCDYLLCEDTRRSRILLNHYELKIPLQSFHLHNERKKSENVLHDLSMGKTIGLLSDAGTPGINDPGMYLVRLCREQELDVIALPGPCAAITALSASGLDTSRFQFFGFLPKKPGKLRKSLAAILDYPGTTIAYESPYRVLATLRALEEIDPERLVVVARELTKKFETYYRGTAAEILSELKTTKGEFVLLFSGQI